VYLVCIYYLPLRYVTPSELAAMFDVRKLLQWILVRIIITIMGYNCMIWIIDSLQKRSLMQKHTCTVAYSNLYKFWYFYPSLLHSFTPGSKPLSSTNSSHHRFFYVLNSLTITGLSKTYHAHHFIFSFTFYF